MEWVSMRQKIVFLISIILILYPYYFYADNDPTLTPPNPGEKVLLIYVGNGANPCSTYSTQMKDAVKNALLSITPAPQIDELVIPCGNRNGFYDELVSQYGVTNLRNWCEVWDLRFLDLRNNLAFDGTIWEDVLTYIGPAGQTDWDLFIDFLNNGGHLYLQGEHHDYYCRNTNLMMFINYVANSPIGQSRANVRNGAWTVNQFSSTPENFSTDFTTLSGNMNANYCGGISLTQIGSGRPLVTTDLGASSDPAAPGGMSAVVMGYLPADLKTNGRMVVGWETNMYTEPTLKNTVSDNMLKNIYDLLSKCYNYSVTKSFNPGTLCVGNAGQMQICYQNSGAGVTSVDIWDTIPSCLNVTNISFTGGTPSSSGGPINVSGGKLYWWRFTPFNSGANGCIVINFTATQLPPCP